ncbi:hypothetical protein [Clostridium rectalis]|uniref:hypothetical protein n=1 Tax=Clostridium rectalis TaxID=2040295 RepID=UPI0013DE768E|nr:hypothetical protein [Clostridium rectalis]
MQDIDTIKQCKGCIYLTHNCIHNKTKLENKKYICIINKNIIKNCKYKRKDKQI